MEAVQGFCCRNKKVKTEISTRSKKQFIGHTIATTGQEVNNENNKLNGSKTEHNIKLIKV